MSTAMPGSGSGFGHDKDSDEDLKTDSNTYRDLDTGLNNERDPSVKKNLLIISICIKRKQYKL